MVNCTHWELWQAKQTKHDKVWRLQSNYRTLPSVWLCTKYLTQRSQTPRAKKIPVISFSFSSRKWLETDFQDLVCHQRAAVASKSCRAAGMSVANGILTVLKAWNGICGPHEVFSMGVLCPGEDTECDLRHIVKWGIQSLAETWWDFTSFTGFYDLPEGIVLSVPVSFVDGKWSVRFDVTVGDELKERLKISASELKQVRQDMTAKKDVAHVASEKWQLFFFHRKKNLDQKCDYCC